MKYRIAFTIIAATVLLVAVLVSSGLSVPAPPGFSCDGVWVYTGGPGTNMGWTCIGELPEWEAELEIGVSPSFADTAGHWAEPIIARMATLGIIRGVSATSFEPERGITRAEAATLHDRVLRLVLGNAVGLSSLTARVDDLDAAVDAVGHLRFQTRGKFTFKNETGQEVNDLHISWRDGIHLIDPMPEPFGRHSGNGTNTHDFSRGSVPAGDEVEFWFGSTGNRVTIREWYWTKDGNRVGAVHSGHADNID